MLVGHKVTICSLTQMVSLRMVVFFFFSFFEWPPCPCSALHQSCDQLNLNAVRLVSLWSTSSSLSDALHPSSSSPSSSPSSSSSHHRPLCCGSADSLSYVHFKWGSGCFFHFGILCSDVDLCLWSKISAALVCNVFFSRSSTSPHSSNLASLSFITATLPFRTGVSDAMQGQL